MFAWGASVYFKIYSQPKDAIEINVAAKQWMWKFQRAEGQREINELRVPVGRPVKLILASQDVIHSFFVPAFRVHRDVLPNRYTTVWFQATKTGRFHLFCSQYCGTEHSNMAGYVEVMSADDYARWLSSGSQDSMAGKGESLFQKYSCAVCHTGDSKARAPLLENLYGNQVILQNGERVTADDEYLRESIVNPQAKIVAGYQGIMPTFQAQLAQLIAYIKSLGRERKQLPPVSSPDSPQPAPAGQGVQQRLPSNAAQTTSGATNSNNATRAATSVQNGAAMNNQKTQR